MAEQDILDRIALCCERGKVDNASPFPPEMKGEDGVDEWVKRALDEGVDPSDILMKGMMPGMSKVGDAFNRGEIFVPDLLMAAKAMSVGLAHLKPYFESGAAKRRGVFVIGTVLGDLHDIGKNLARMMVEGGGWEVIDLGNDTSAESFLEAVEANPGCAVGLSAMLTTTMVNMREIVRQIREKAPDTHIMVGGAPLTQDFCDQIGANLYCPDPKVAVDYLNEVFA